MNSDDQAKIDLANDYFHRLDQGRADVLDLFTDDLEFYFPKFGVTRGKAAFSEFSAGFKGQLEHIRHDYQNLIYLPFGEYLTVEGTSQGKLSGKTWEGGKTPGGRFCNVFHFRGGKIARLHVYLDPDYTGDDTPRFRWGTGRTW